MPRQKFCKFWKKCLVYFLMHEQFWDPHTVNFRLSSELVDMGTADNRFRVMAENGQGLFIILSGEWKPGVRSVFYKLNIPSSIIIWNN